MADVDTSNWSPGTHFYTRITEHNHSGWVYIVTIMSLCYILAVTAVRFVVKYGMYGRDDWALLVSTVLAIGQHIAIMVGLSNGMGRSSTLLSGSAIQGIEQSTAAHSFLFVLAHCVSKLSTALLCQRLFHNSRKRNSYICWVLVGASIFYGVWAVLSLAIGCPQPGFALHHPDQCSNRYLRWQMITAIDIVTETMLVVAPCFLLLKVQIKREAKLLVMAVFAVRLPDIIFSALNLKSIQAATNSTDVGLALVMPLIWTQSELFWSIMSASVPCLKAFFRPFDSIDEETWRSNNGGGYASQRSGRSWQDPKDNDASVMKSGRGQRRRMRGSATGLDRSVPARPDGVGHDVSIAHNAHDAVEDDNHSWGSQERIIHARTQWEVKTEPRDPYEIP